MTMQVSKVQFSDHDTVHEIQNVKDMEEKDFSAVYFTVDELRSLRDECKTLVRMIDEGLHLSPSGKQLFDTRGLENQTKANKRKTRELRDSLYDSIHATQRGSDGWGDSDTTDALAMMSRCLYYFN